MAYEAVPGLVETKVAYGETTVVVDPARVLEAAYHLRDAEGFGFLADVTAADYLGWGEKGVAGHIGTAGGRDLNAPGSQGYARLPEPKPRRFSVSYHLLQLGRPPRRLRLQAWLDDGQEVGSVVAVWPAADWFEREVFDMFGIRFADHPNLRRILMEDDWDGHPLRKDYPLGGEPVRFSEAE